MEKDIKISAFDLDYTLLDTEKRVSPANYAALEKAAAAGYSDAVKSLTKENKR